MEDEIIKRINALDIESKAKLLKNIDSSLDNKIKDRIKNNVYAKAGIIKPPPKRYHRVPLIAAAIIVVLLFSMGAAYYSGIAQYFGEYFNKIDTTPLSSDETNLLEQTGQMLQMKATGEGYTVELSGLVGDGDRMYGYVRVTADNGKPMDKQYKFKNCFLYLPEDREQKNIKGRYMMPEPLPDDNSNDNEVNFMVNFEPFIDKFGERVNFAGTEIAIDFQDLVECSDKGNIVTDLAYHDWEITFILKDNQTIRTFSFQDATVTLEGCSYAIEQIRLSPLSLNIDGILEVMVAAKNWSSLPISIIQKDGTIIDSFYENTGSSNTQDMPEGFMAMKKNIIFCRPIDPNFVKSIKINGVEIELKNKN